MIVTINSGKPGHFDEGRVWVSRKRDEMDSEPTYLLKTGGWSPYAHNMPDLADGLYTTEQLLADPNSAYMGSVEKAIELCHLLKIQVDEIL